MNGRLFDLFRRRRLDAELNEELRHHAASLEAEHRARGLSADEARDAARRDLGGLVQTREAYRDQHGLPSVESLWRDVRHGARSLRRTPGVTLAIIATLAIAIGANTAIFSVIHGVLLKPLPYPHPDALVSVVHATPGVGGDLPAAPYLYFTYRDESRTFERVGIWRGGQANVTGLDRPEQVPTIFVTADILPLLGVAPQVGRAFTEQDASPGAPPTVVLTYGYWQRRFGGDPAAVGRTLQVGGTPFEIVGVMPRAFRFLDRPVDLFIPLQLDRSQVRLGRYIFQGLARLRPGTTLAQANADVARMIPLAIDAFPPPDAYVRQHFRNTGIRPNLRPLERDVIGDLGRLLWVVMGALGLVLAMACANVANLLLVRTEGRQQELAIRAALGAGWQRIARELLIESLLLGLAGGAAGLAVAQAGLGLLLALRPEHLPRIDEIALDPAALLFTLALAVLAGLFFGLLPVVKYARPRVSTMLRGAGRSMSASREQHRARNALVVLQVAFALVLLVCAGLMIRTFQALSRVDPGFTQPETVQMAQVSIPAAVMPDNPRVTRMQQEIATRIAAIPGVRSVAFADIAPLSGGDDSDTVLFTDGRPYPPGQRRPLRRFEFISPGLFHTLGTPIVAGRDLQWEDLHDGRIVALVSDGLARDEWGSAAAALGKRVRSSPGDPWREVVGVIGDVHDDGVSRRPPPIVYFPALMEQFGGQAGPSVWRSVTFVIRTPRAGTGPLMEEVERAVWSVNPNLPLARVHTLQDAYRKTLARSAFALVMLAMAAAMGLLLGVIGIYAIVAYAVTQRTREIGIRLALGAPAGTVKRLFVSQGVALAGIGVVGGLAAAVPLTRVLSSFLFGVSPLDPVTFAVVTIVLLTVVVLAAYVPARRSTRVSPLQALR